MTEQTNDIYILKTDVRKNLVFGWANVPHPVQKIYTDVEVEGSLEEQLHTVRSAWYEAYPTQHEQGIWTNVVAVFKKTVVGEVSSIDGSKLFEFPYKMSSKGEVTFEDGSEVTVEFVAKAVAEEITKQEPKTDLQGDRIDLEVLEEGAYQFVLKSRTAGVNHSEIGVGSLVESIVITDEKLEAMGIPEDVRSSINKGWWIGFQVDPEVMERVDSGEFNMFSIGGKAVGVTDED